MQTAKTALILGASGLVGSQVLHQLLLDRRYSRVTVLVRRIMHISNPKLVQHEVDFDHLDEYEGMFAVDDVFCCLGTTIKKAGSQEAFYKVDATYPYKSAQLAAKQGVSTFVLITAMGADKKSSFFYNRVKGEVEDKIRALPLKSLIIVRPSLLLGARGESRLGENIGQYVMGALKFLMVGPLKKYQAIEDSTVAKAMIALANHTLTGIHIIESDRLQELGS